MIDGGLSHVIVKRLNRYYRSRSQPHGIADLSFRGTRMCYNNAYRLGTILVSLPLLAIVVGPFFIPHYLSDFLSKPLVSSLFLVTCWMGILAVACLAPLEAFHEFVVITEEGLIRSNLFGQRTRIDWKDISSLSIDGNEISFWTAAGTRVKANLCYNGWQDFLEISARHLDPELQLRLEFAIHNANPKGRQLQNVNS